MSSQPQPTAEAVRQRLADLLPTLDMETTTERHIRDRLAAELGAPVEPHFKLITECIEEFLAGQDSGDDDFEVGDKRNAAPMDRKSAKAPAAKAAVSEFVLPLTKKRKLSVGKFKGNVNVSIREHYEKDGQEHPGKGLTMTPAQWVEVRAVLPQLAAGLAQGSTDLSFQLSNNRRAYVSEFRGAKNVHVREFYEKDGEMQPGAKGVVLDVEAVQLLIDHGAEVDGQVVSAGGQLGAAAAALQAGASGAGASTSAPKASTPAATPAAAKPAKAAAAAAPAAAPAAHVHDSGSAPAASGVSPTADGLFELGSLKFASYSEFKGQGGIDLRTYYQKDGKTLPTQKGIRLTPAEWRLLTAGVPQIDAALAASNTAFELKLTDKRKAAISSFKGKTYVNVREYYEKDGQLAPGTKGLSMASAEWQKLKASIDQLNERLP